MAPYFPAQSGSMTDTSMLWARLSLLFHASTNMAAAVKSISFFAPSPFLDSVICKFSYLFFPRHVHDSAGIVVGAFAEKRRKPSLHPCPLYKWEPDMNGAAGLGTCQSTPDNAGLEREI